MIPVLLAVLAFGPEKAVTQPTRITTAWVAPQIPRVASEGDDFFVVWNGGSNAAHVASDGTVLDRPSLHIDAPANVRWFDVARYRDQSVIGWYSFTDSGVVHVRAANFDVVLPDADVNSSFFQLLSNGSVLAAAYHLRTGGGGITFLDSGRTVTLNSAGRTASDGNNFLVLQGMSAVLLSSTGDPLTIIPLPFLAADVIFDGSDYLIAGTSGNQIETQRLSPNGAAGATTLIENNAAAGRGGIYGLTLSSAGRDVLVAWKEVSAPAFPSGYYTDSLEVRSGSAKTLDLPLDETLGRFNYPGDPPQLASNGRTFLLVWTEGSSLLGVPSRNLFSVLLRPSETLTKSDLDQRKKAVPSTFAAQSNPTAARNGEELLLAWSESVDPQRHQIVAARLTANGDDLDGPGIVIAPSASDQQFPAAAWDGSRTWIVWTEIGKGIQATAFGSLPATISPVGEPLRIACGNDACLVIWSENQRDLYAARIVHGQLLAPFLIGSGQTTVTAGDYDVASNGSDFDVVWADRLAAGGAILHTLSGNIAATTNSYRNVHIVWNGNEFDVLWNEGTALRGSRLDANGNSIDGEATAWAGVRVAGALPIEGAGDALYVGSSTGVVQLDPATLTITASAEIGYPTIIGALDRDHIFALYTKGGPLYLRQLATGRIRAVR